MKELNKKILEAKKEITRLKEEMDRVIEESKPVLKLDFLSTKELVNNTDPVMAKSTQDKIKKDLKELNKQIDSLWK